MKRYEKRYSFPPGLLGVSRSWRVQSYILIHLGKDTARRRAKKPTIKKSIYMKIWHRKKMFWHVDESFHIWETGWSPSESKTSTKCVPTSVAFATLHEFFSWFWSEFPSRLWVEEGQILHSKCSCKMTMPKTCKKPAPNLNNCGSQKQFAARFCKRQVSCCAVCCHGARFLPSTPTRFAFPTGRLSSVGVRSSFGMHNREDFNVVGWKSHILVIQVLWKLTLIYYSGIVFFHILLNYYTMLTVSKYSSDHLPKTPRCNGSFGHSAEPQRPRCFFMAPTRFWCLGQGTRGCTRYSSGKKIWCARINQRNNVEKCLERQSSVTKYGASNGIYKSLSMTRWPFPVWENIPCFDDRTFNNKQKGNC